MWGEEMLKQETLNLLNGSEKNFKDVFSICIGKTYITQKRFIEYIGKYDSWNTDVTKGFLQLDDRNFDVEFIGTTSVSDSYWYSSELESIIPDEYVNMMINVRNKLESLNLNDVAAGKIMLQDEINGYNLSMIYIAFAQENVAYFNGSGNTSIYMFVKNLPSELFKRINSVEFSNSIMEIVSNFNVNHKLMVKALLIENDYEFEEKDNNIIAKFSENSLLTIELDNYDRIIKVSGNLSL